MAPAWVTYIKLPWNTQATNFSSSQRARQLFFLWGLRPLHALVCTRIQKSRCPNFAGKGPRVFCRTCCRAIHYLGRGVCSPPCWLGRKLDGARAAESESKRAKWNKLLATLWRAAERPTNIFQWIRDEAVARGWGRSNFLFPLRVSF